MKKIIDSNPGKKRIISAHMVFIEFVKFRFRSEIRLITIKKMYVENNNEKYIYILT
jgi:hypothetical protein